MSIAALLEKARLAIHLASERGPSDAAGVALATAWLHAPPWRDRLRDGSLGPEYGPTDMTAARASYNLRGFWDPSEVPAPRRRTAPIESDGIITQAEFLRRIGHRLAPRVLAVLTALVLDRRTVQRTATQTGVAAEEVRHIHALFLDAWLEPGEMREATP